VFATGNGVKFVAEISITVTAKEMNQNGRKRQEEKPRVATPELANAIRLVHEGSWMHGFTLCGGIISTLPSKVNEYYMTAILSRLARCGCDLAGESDGT
jgi:hypothetical protein